MGAYRFRSKLNLLIGPYKEMTNIIVAKPMKAEFLEYIDTTPISPRSVMGV